MPGGWEIDTITASDNEVFDGHLIEENLTEGAASIRTKVPPLYQGAALDNPEIQEWANGLVFAARLDDRSPCPAIVRGRSLLLLGPIGTGKTYAAYAAIQALVKSGARCRWECITEAGFIAKLRPRPRVDSEEEFERYSKVALLVIDDMGASKDTEWAAEQNYRLLDHRYAWDKPTIITSNLLPRDLVPVLGERVASRLRAMTTTVSFKGQDRRRS
jgi:DNA replication protein DnaC